VIAVGTALAALALSLAACGSGGTGAGPRAHAWGAHAPAAPSPSPSTAFGKFRRVDAVALLKRDPGVSAAVKRELKPCDGDDYQVDVSYADLTDAPVDDVVINVMTCADWVGIGSYVYRDENGVFRNVFKSEESPVYAEIDRGTLSVTRQYYEQDDPISSPSGDIVTPYTWKAGRFVPGKPTRNEYGKSADGTPRPVPAT
jgi:hypothetical protein